ASSVAQRLKEVGIRLALGAGRQRIAALVLTEGLKPVLVGIIGGLCVSVAAVRAIRSLLFGVAPFDLPSYVFGLSVLLVAAICGCWVPMRAAIRIDPAISIRYE